MSDLLLRAATAADEPLLLSLAARLADFPVPAWRTREQIARADHQILQAAIREGTPDRLLLIAERPAGTPLGYVFVTSKSDYFTGRGHAHIEILVVRPEAEGQGIGRALLAASEAWARSRGLESITLNVFAQNERALELYRRQGYATELIKCWKGL
jgi:ribosomal protein S18 acetylase RimI-like enzyme